MGGRLLTTMHG